MLGCDTGPTDPVAGGGDAARGPLGKADASGSCFDAEAGDDFCGGRSAGACWCDDLCTWYGDCCGDYERVCIDLDPSGSEGDSGSEGESEGGEEDDDGGQVDTCPVPEASFVYDGPSNPSGSYTSRRHAVLQVADDGTPSIYASQRYQNGSFYSANIVRLTPAGEGWTSSTHASGQGLGIGRSISATSGVDPCVSYIDDYNGYLHVRCDSFGSRVIAPRAYSVALAELDGQTQAIFGNSGTMSWLPIDGGEPAAESFHTGWSLGAHDLAIDDEGRPHVVYVALTSGGGQNRTIRYATRTDSGWTTSAIDIDRSSTSSAQGVTVSIVVVDGEPVIAYHHLETRSLRLAVPADDGFVTSTLGQPTAGFDNDSVGRSVALATDCMDRIHAVYQRRSTTAPQPSLNLYYAQLEDGELTDVTALPMTYSTAYIFGGSWPDSLGFHIGADGSQHVAAELQSVYGNAIYYAER